MPWPRPRPGAARAALLALAVLVLSPSSSRTLAQRRYSKFGVPSIYQRQRVDDAIVFPGEASNAFQGLYEQTSGSTVGDRFRLAAEALFSIAVRLQGLLEDPNALTNGPRGNFLVSPLSVTAALGQLALGSRGESHRLLGELLSLPGQAGQANRKRSVMQLHLQMGGLLEILTTDAFGRSDDKFELSTASAFFVAPYLRIFPRFRREANEMYGTQVISMNFADPAGAQKRINNWVSQQTRGLIRSALSSPLPANTAAVLSNSVYMKAAWRYPFAKELTAPGIFRTTLTQQVPVQFMRGQFNLRLADNPRLRIRVLHLPYRRSDVGFYILLPYDVKNEEYDIHNLTSHLSVTDMIETLSSMKLEQVTVSLPRMSLRESFSVKEPLRRFQQQYREQLAASAANSRLDSPIRNRIGTRDTHKMDVNGCTCTCPSSNPSASFLSDRSGFPKPAGSDVTSYSVPSPTSSLRFNMTNASNDPRFQLQDIVHQMFFEVNEEGTEGAAVTSGTVDYISGKTFRVDRPFTFFVRHESTLATIFWATIVNPNAS